MSKIALAAPGGADDGRRRVPPAVGSRAALDLRMLYRSKLLIGVSLDEAGFFAGGPE